MYVQQYGGGGRAPHAMYGQAPAAYQTMPQAAVSSGYFPQQMPGQVQQLPPQQAVQYGQYGQPTAAVQYYQSPREPSAQTEPYSVTMAPGSGYGAVMQQPAMSYTYPAGVAPQAAQTQGVPDYSSQQAQQVVLPQAAQQQYGGAPVAHSQFPAALTQPTAGQEGEPDDDDPNRLPTFVKVRGLPAEHDPRIARRPKPKKRAPGVCCA
mmetsp:Transcript_90181/g.160622  ORF Transcript_90181/g.160622 Transcript_90181/m.160622 type:complete len:207 (-) Transcript_90181:62-682(-)